MKESIIQKQKGLNLIGNFIELYAYRELIWILAWKDIKVKYAQTLIGFSWAVIEPLITTILLSLVFNKVANASTLGVNPILFGLSAMLCWSYFSNVALQGSNSLIMSQNMIKKTYFPRLAIPLSKVFASLPDLFVTIILTTIVFVIYPQVLTIKLALFPIFLLLVIFFSAGVSMLFSALNIRYRDFKHVVPFLIRLGLFITPIAYSTTEIDPNYKWLFYLNPMTGIIEGIRWSIFGHTIMWPYFLLSMLVLFISLTGAYIYFNYMQKNIADII